MPSKEGLFISNRVIGFILVGMLGGGGAIGVGGFTLSNGVSNSVTEDIRQTIRAVIESEAMLTPEEAEVWADERNSQKRQQERIDETLMQHTEEIVMLRRDVIIVQLTVDEILSQQIMMDSTIGSIAREMGVE